MPGLVKTFSRLLIAAAVSVAVAGCAAAADASAVPEGNAPPKADYPAPGGTYYQSGRPEVTVARLMEMLEFADRRVLRPEKEFRQEHVTTALLRLAILLSGADRIQGYEASSFPAGETGWYRNTRLWKSKEAIPLFLLAAENGTLEPASLGGLPRNTVFALRVEWDPVVFFQALKFAPSHEKALGSFLQGMTGMEPEALAATARGCWEFVGVAVGNETVVRITLPDADGKFYDFLKTLLDTTEGDGPFPTVERSGKRTSYYSDREKKHVFSAPEKFQLGKTPSFQNAWKALPRTRGAILFWLDWDPGLLAGVQPSAAEGEFQDLRFRGLTLMRRVPEGLISWSVSRQDLNTETHHALFPLLIPALSEMSGRMAPASEETSAAPETAEQNAAPAAERPAGEPSKEAADLLKTAYGILREAATETGAFPNEKRAAELLGSQMLTHFCYVPGWTVKDNGKLPLLIQRPGDGQKDEFLVLTVDGSCQLIRLEEYRSLKRAAGELHSRNNYSEQEFIQLIRRMVEADRKMRPQP